MEDIYNYIAMELLSPENAMGQYNRIAEEIMTLDVFSQCFRIIDCEPEKCRECSMMLSAGWIKISVPLILFLKKQYSGGIDENIRLCPCEQ